MATAQRVCYIFNDYGQWYFNGLAEIESIEALDTRSGGHRHRIGAMRSAFAEGYTHAEWSIYTPNLAITFRIKRVKLKGICA